MPTYHSEIDAHTERQIAEYLTRMGWQTRLMDVSCRWDIEASKEDKRLVVEVKRRNMTWGQYPTVFVDKAKVDAMTKRASELLGLPILVILPNDMTPRFVHLVPTGDWGTNVIDVRPERQDQSDRGDLKYEIPIEEFSVL